MPSKKHTYCQTKKDGAFQDEKEKSTVRLKHAGTKYKMYPVDLDWLDDLSDSQNEAVGMALLINASSVRLH